MTALKDRNNLVPTELVVKGLDICISPLTGKSEQQRFTMPSGILTSISRRQSSPISGQPLPEWTLDPLSAASIVNE